MTTTRAVLFDFGGTLYDYRDLERASREGLRAFVDWHRTEVDDAALLAAYRQALRKVFYQYLPRPFYHHRDLFRDALLELVRELGLETSDDLLERHQSLQRRLQARDFRLRPGVVATLEELRRRDLHVGMVSNIDQDHLEHLVDVAGIREHFHSLLSSEAAGSCKPDQSFFRQALERAGCEAGAALFVGDSLPQDIAGANRAGMRSVLIWSGEDEPQEAEHRPAHVVREIPEVLSLLR
ncbi:MAG TPA: HAD family hydrolase [Thermoanaerobaculia bacterium]|nr:HAD family hydrolase [Thermoanaerobaculia bacterium]